MAIDFNGSTDYYIVGSTPVTAVPLTFSCLFRGGGTSQALMTVGVDGGTHRFQMNISAGSVLQATSQAAAGANATGTTNVVASSTTWYHGCAVFASATSRSIYTDGTDKQSNATSNTPTGLNRITIGARISTTLGAFFAGEIADVAIWNVALSDAEVAVLSKAISAKHVRPQSLVFYSPLVREPIDIRGGLTLTAGGTPTVTAHPRIYS